MLDLVGICVAKTMALISICGLLDFWCCGSFKLSLRQTLSKGFPIVYDAIWTAQCKATDDFCKLENVIQSQ